MIRPEQALLTRIATPAPEEARLLEAVRFLSDIDDHERLVRYAEREGLAELLYANLGKADALSLLRPGPREILHERYRTTARRNLGSSRDLIEILDELGSGTVTVVLLKGIALLGEVYPDIATRPMGDIDLWVLQDHIDRFTRVMTGLGYARDPDYPMTWLRNRTTIDLHTHPLGSDRIRSREQIITVDGQGLFDATREGTFEGRAVRRLGRPDQVIYLGLHALKHNLSRLIWLADLQGILTDSGEDEWTSIIDRADQLGQRETIARVTHLLERLLGSGPPADFTAHGDLPRVGRFERAILGKRSLDEPLPGWAPFIFFMPARGSGHRLRNIMESLFPRPEVLRQAFTSRPGLSDWQLYIARVLQIIGWSVAAIGSGIRSLFR